MKTALFKQQGFKDIKKVYVALVIKKQYTIYIY